MIEQAQQYFEAGNFPAAEALYRQMLEDEPDNPEVLFMLSLVRQGQDDLEEPVKLLEHALRVQPKNPTLHFTLANVQLRRKKLEEASRCFHEAATLDPNFADAQNGIAIVELTRGRFAAAEHALRKALKSEPENVRVLVNLGLAKLEQGRADEALPHLRQALDLEPENEIAQFHMGRTFMNIGNEGFAIQCFENVLQRNPNSMETLKLLAAARMTSGQYRAAAENYRQVLAKGLDSAEVMSGLARAEYAVGHLKEAEGAFIRALRLAPEDESLALDYMQLLIDQRRFDEVRSRLDKLEVSEERASRRLRLLAEARLDSGDAQGAMDLLRPVMSAGAPTDRMRLTLARVLMATGEPDAAASQLDRLMQSDLPLVDAVQMRIRQHMESLDFQRAIDELRELRKRPDLTPRQRLKAAAMLADSLHRDGQYQAAWEQMAGLEQRPAEVIQIRQEKPLQLVQNEPAETAMDRDVAWSWPPQPPQDGRADPTFILAWPGSGRESLIQTLAGHPALTLVNDSVDAQKPRRLVISHPQGKGPLNEITIAEIEMARKKYWKSLRRVAVSQGASHTVDGIWLTVEALPTIYRLFPHARIIVLQHDPADLLLYWLQSGYEDLEGMAAFWRKQQALLEKCRAGVPLNYIDLQASELISDPARVLRDLVASLDVAWDDGIETAWQAAMKRDLADPGAGAHYAEWLEQEQRAMGLRSA